MEMSNTEINDPRDMTDYDNPVVHIVREVAKPVKYWVMAAEETDGGVTYTGVREGAVQIISVYLPPNTRPHSHDRVKTFVESITLQNIEHELHGGM